MNYFELFELPLSFEVDKTTLTKAYYKLSAQYHPDRYTLETEDKQSEALEKSAEINKAFKILQNKQSTIRYVLELFDAAPEEGNETMPQDFLMEMMDLNDEIMDHKMDPTESSEKSVKKKIELLKEDLETTFESSKGCLAASSPDQTQLESIKDYYLKSKYLKRVLDNLNDQGVEM